MKMSALAALLLVSAPAMAVAAGAQNPDLAPIAAVGETKTGDTALVAPNGPPFTGSSEFFRLGHLTPGDQVRIRWLSGEPHHLCFFPPGTTEATWREPAWPAVQEVLWPGDTYDFVARQGAGEYLIAAREVADRGPYAFEVQHVRRVLRLSLQTASRAGSHLVVAGSATDSAGAPVTDGRVVVSLLGRTGGGKATLLGRAPVKTGQITFRIPRLKSPMRLVARFSGSGSWFGAGSAPLPAPGQGR